MNAAPTEATTGTAYLPYAPRLVDADLVVLNRTLQTARAYYREQGWLDESGAFAALLESLNGAPAVDVRPPARLMDAVPEDRVAVALRFDVDVDPFTALRLARQAARVGTAIGVYPLHTAYYYGRFDEQGFARHRLMAWFVRGLALAGAEIGLHIDPLGVYASHGRDGAEALVTEIKWLRSLGLVIEGTAAHNSSPVYGAENFEIFSGRAAWGRSAVARGERVLPLGVLNERELGLKYEANYSRPIPGKPSAADLRWIRGEETASIRDEGFMRRYLGRSPSIDRMTDAVVWHHGGGRWSVSVRPGGVETAWRWFVDQAEVMRIVERMPGGSRVLFILHPVYFAADAPADEFLTAPAFVDAPEDEPLDEGEAPPEAGADAGATGAPGASPAAAAAAAAVPAPPPVSKAVEYRLARAVFGLVPPIVSRRLPEKVTADAAAYIMSAARSVARAAVSRDRRQAPVNERVLMLTVSALRVDPRVQKVARSLAGAGLDVEVYAPDQDHAPEMVEERGERLRFVWAPWHAEGAHFRLSRYFQKTFVSVAMSRGPYGYVHANDLLTLPTAWAIAKRMGARLIYDAHEMFSENVTFRDGAYRAMPDRQRKLLSDMERQLLKRVDLFTSVSPSICDEYARRYGESYRPMLLANFPERSLLDTATPDAPSVKAMLGLPEDTWVTIYVGGVNPARNIETVIEAHRLLPERFVFVIRGPGVEYYGPKYTEQAEAMGIGGRVQFLPPTTPERVLDGSRGADCGIVMLRDLCKNFYWYYPNKFFEYMLAGLPVLVSNFPDVSAHIARERCGLTVDPDSAESIAAGIRALADDPESARRMGERGRASVLATYNWDEAIKPYVAAYKALASQPAAGARPR